MDINEATAINKGSDFPQTGDADLDLFLTTLDTASTEDEK